MSRKLRFFFSNFRNFFLKIKQKQSKKSNLSIAIETGLSKVFLKCYYLLKDQKIETQKAMDIVLSDFIVVMLVKKAFSRVVVLLTFCEKAVSRHTVLY